MVDIKNKEKMHERQVFLRIVKSVLNGIFFCSVKKINYCSPYVYSNVTCEKKISLYSLVFILIPNYKTKKVDLGMFNICTYQ